MIDLLVIGFVLGGLFIYLLIMSIPSPKIDWREHMLTQLTCYDCDKLVAPVEFTLHGGLCEDCFKERHGYNHSSAPTMIREGDK